MKRKPQTDLYKRDGEENGKRSFTKVSLEVSRYVHIYSSLFSLS